MNGEWSGVGRVVGTAFVWALCWFVLEVVVFGLGVHYVQNSSLASKRTFVRDLLALLVIQGALFGHAGVCKRGFMSNASAHVPRNNHFLGTSFGF
jgi:hypothetical protein